MRSLILSLVASTLGFAGMAQAEDPDPLTVEPSQFELAFLLPQNAGIEKGSVKLVFQGKIVSTGQVNSHEYTLVQSNTLNGPSNGLIKQRGGAHYAIFRFADRDLERVRSQQKAISIWKAADSNDVTGDIGVDADFCKTGALKSYEKTRFYISVGDGFELLMKGTLKDMVGPDGIPHLPACS